MNIKKCGMCKEIKSLSCFYKKKNSHGSMCKKCYADYYENNKDRIKSYNREYRKTPNGKKSDKKRAENNIEKIIAKDRLNYALCAGHVKREACKICNSSHNVNGHHGDYSKPYAVDWLCGPCHALWHQILNEWQRQEESGRWYLQAVSLSALDRA